MNTWILGPDISIFLNISGDAFIFVEISHCSNIRKKEISIYICMDYRDVLLLHCTEKEDLYPFTL